LKQKSLKISTESENNELIQQDRNKLVKSQRVELFSTDSELDSFFKENENFIKKSGYDSSRDFAARVENNKDDDFDDLDFDRMVTEAQRLVVFLMIRNTFKKLIIGLHMVFVQNKIVRQNQKEII
jgi:hypothetical protein